jgi:hypothetical protein
MLNIPMRCLLFVLLPVLFSLSFCFTGCVSDDLVTDPGDKLSFSVDTLSFDTLFSTVGSTTAWLKVRNTGNHTIRIASVVLKSGGNTGFRMNLDGLSGLSFTNVDIPAHDSLFLFVEITSPEQGATMPVRIVDAILFNTDGAQKQIVLEAWSWDAVIWHGKTITADTTLTGDKPFIIYDSLVVAGNSTLTINPGAQFFFHDKAFMKVAGTLKAIGTVAAPIVMRGDRLDNVLTDFPYDYYPGQWGYLRLTGTSFNNELDHVTIRGAYYGIMADSSALDRTKLTLSNSVIHNMVYNSLVSVHSTLFVSNSQLTNSGNYTVELVGGNATFIHCTIANYQRLVSRDGPALVLANYLSDSQNSENAHPLQAAFHNCIIFGSQSAELGFVKSQNTAISWALVFGNCLLRSEALSTNMATTTECIYSSDAHFLKLGTLEEKYVFDFRIDSISPAWNAGDVSYLTLFPTDLNGVSRSNHSRPDIGAYEWFEGQK